ncbi:MAG: hypothetical protein QXG39_01495 [Candidatus Aenigmatarchaeota archaeon]
MSAILQRFKETVLPEERLKKKAIKTLDIADKIIIETQARQLNLKKCAEYQKSMLESLHDVMDACIKIGNKNLYIQSAKLAEVVAEWHKITVSMKEDQETMIKFIAMIKSFYWGVIEYRQVVKDFTRTVKDFNTLKRFGLSIPKQIEITSAEAARSFQELVGSIASIKVSYTRLSDYTLLNEVDEERLSKRFDEERQKLLNEKESSK